jgi:Ni,Fe-hydrogenase maturation factor
MKVFVFGNPDVAMDSLPIRILPELQKRLPNIEFIVQDPNEELALSEAPENIIILDTAVGISEVTVFDDLKKFATVPRVSMHDFDALTNLRYLQKLGKIKAVKIIAIPAENKATLPALADKVALILSQQ